MKINVQDVAGFEEGVVENDTVLALIPKKYLEHINASALAGEIEISNAGDVVTVVGRSGCVHVRCSSNIDLGYYHYRGRIFERREDVASGWYGAWAVGRDWTDSLKDCKAIIDRKLEKK